MLIWRIRWIPCTEKTTNEKVLEIHGLKTLIGENIIGRKWKYLTHKISKNSVFILILHKENAEEMINDSLGGKNRSLQI